jgi:hypothetical protein
MLLTECQFYIADPGCYVKMYIYNIRFELQMEIPYIRIHNQSVCIRLALVLTVLLQKGGQSA